MTTAFLYKCRRCGAIERNPKVGKPGNTNLVTTHLLNAISNTPSEAQAPTLISVHSCGPDACGVSDLIGYEPEIDPNETSGSLVQAPSQSEDTPKTSAPEFTGAFTFPIGSRWRTSNGREIVVTMYYELTPGSWRLCYDGPNGSGGHMGQNHIDRLTPIDTPHPRTSLHWGLELEVELVRLEHLTAIAGMDGKPETFSDLYDAREAVRNAANRERRHSSTPSVGGVF